MTFNNDLQQYFSGVFDERIQRELDEGFVHIPELEQRIKEAEFYLKKDIKNHGITYTPSSGLINGKNLVKLCGILNIDILLFASNNFEVFRGFYCSEFNKTDIQEESVDQLKRIISQCVGYISETDPIVITQLGINTPISVNEIYNLKEMYQGDDIYFKGSVGHIIKLAKLLRISWNNNNLAKFNYSDWIERYKSDGLKFPRSPLIKVPNLKKRISEWLKRGGMFKSELDKVLNFNHRSGLHYWVKRNELPIHFALEICGYLKVLEREFLIELSKPAAYRILRGARLGAHDGSSLAQDINFYDY